ncbi:cytochrome P450 CYP3/CYP5/CYP6/CYP9 [Rhizodiscina lignyota]|uniref:Cytochrome P450 CYP3/CYP5/CYP6/CYP9 n=1 Tax=Rhizodiscina lignyota TaxID=1504668 RepID=A0A9P4IH25_9PEZI|nr:cytochrome P450 CYP3/CYP5/CYP6/CYP9 [Rhizodiscina lignyota]
MAITGFSHSLNSLNAIALLAFAAFIWILSWGIYHAYFHPLSRYPGPKLWAAYRVPFALNNIRGRLPFKVLEFHRKYGPVVRIAPDELAFTDPHAWNDIYGMQSGRVQNQKDPYAYTPRQPGFESGIIHADDAKHARLRRIYGPAFTPKAVEEQAAMLMKYADLLVTQLKAVVQKNPVQDMSAWFNFTTFDLTGDFAFGEAFHCLDRGGEYHFFVKTVFDGVSLGLQMQQLEWYGILSLLKPVIPKSFMKPKLDMDQYTKELVDKRVEQGYVPDRNDVFNYLLLNKNKEDQLTPPELYENGITLVVAGSETTATLLTGTTYFLCKNPEKLQRVQHEVRTMFKEDGEITQKSVNELTYMLAVLSEAMRIYPPTGFGIPRLISSKGGQSIAGSWVPEKTRCSIYHHAAYRYEENFARPDEFIPERWLPDAPAEFRNDKREVVQPFMVGLRGCLGKSLAYAEMRLLLAKMLWHFDFELADPEEDWYGSLKAFMVWERGNLKVRLTPVQL